jgi:peptidoglycan hydrolase-like protein with peptidoglycan-binding domain
LRAARFAGDPVLEDCLANVHRMMAPEQGVAVLKIQQALLDLGFALPDHGADSIFGAETGAAVSEFKRRNALFPDDPGVAHGTMQRLDQIFA